MPNIGDNITLSLPTVSSTIGPDYATDINQAINDLKDILERKIPLSSLIVGQNLSMRGGVTYYDLVDVNALSLAANASSATTQNRSLYFIADELFVLDGAGNEIALTASGSATGSTATNGIITSGTPVYNTSGQILEWHGSNSYYTFYDASTSLADVRVKQLFLTEDDTNVIKLKSPTLAGDITVTMPDVATGASEIVGITSSGVMRASGVASAFLGYSMASGEDITLVGSGRINGFQDTVAIDCASAGHASSGDDANFDSANYFKQKVSPGVLGDVWYISLPLPANTQINSWSLTINKASTTNTTADMEEVSAFGATAAIGAQQASTTSGNVTLAQSGLTDNLTLNSYFQLAVTGGDIGDKYYKLVVTYTYV